MQYRITQNIPRQEKADLALKVANIYLNEGKYAEGVYLEKQVAENEKNKEVKLFLKGKAEFLADNYEGSLSFFDLINERIIPQEYYWELKLYKLLDHNHLLQNDSVSRQMIILFRESGRDTAGLLSELKTLHPPKMLSLKKAGRRSLIFPGAGLFYVGEKKRGVTSSFLSLAFLGYAAYSVYTKYYITAGLTGVSQFLRFYEGGRRSAVKSATAKNRTAYLEYVIKADTFVEKKLSELSGKK
jgi:hypothetical protein